MKKILVKALIVLAAAISLSSCVAGRFMCNYALRPKDHGTDFEATRTKIDERYDGVISNWYDPLYAAGVFKDTTIVGENGYRIHAVYAPAIDPSTAQGTAIVIHGYTNNHLTFSNLTRMYRDSLNYNVFVPDLQYHGESEGRAIQMGWLDRLDIVRWIPIAHDIFGDDFMVIHGVSMGGATTMMVSGEELPGYVRAFVDDCGYSSVWDQFKHNLHDQFHLPPFPVLTSANIVCRRRYGWDFKEASSVNQLAKCDRPMLFIHGGADTYVPTEHVYKNYDAKTQGYKDLWIAPGSAHALAFKDHPDEYIRRVREFLATAREITK